MIDLSEQRVDISAFISRPKNQQIGKPIIAINECGIWKLYDSVVGYVVQLNLPEAEASKRTKLITAVCKKGEKSQKLYSVKKMYFCWADGKLWKDIKKTSKI